MAFNFVSQVAAQREQSQSRFSIKSTIFHLKITEQSTGVGGRKKLRMMVRVPTDLLKKAKVNVNEKIDIHWDHEQHKALLCNSNTGVRLANYADKSNEKDTRTTVYGYFDFAKGYTPDFGHAGFEVKDAAPFHDGGFQGLLFSFPAGLMCTGRNELKEGERPTKPQTVELAAAQAERERTEAAIAEAARQAEERAAKKRQEEIAAPPATAQRYMKQPPAAVAEAMLPPRPESGRRVFSDLQKKEAVRAHLRWMLAGETFGAACKQIDVAESVFRRWRDKFLAEVEKEERRAAQRNRAAAQHASPALHQ